MTLHPTTVACLPVDGSPIRSPWCVPVARHSSQTKSPEPNTRRIWKWMSGNARMYMSAALRIAARPCSGSASEMSRETASGA